MARTKTSPHHKWLLNERAAALGELKAVMEEMRRLEVKRQKLQDVVNSLDNVLEQVGVCVARVTVPLVKPNARYQGYGNLTAWVKGALQNAYPEGLTTTALVAAAELSFGLVFADRKQRSAFQHNCMRTPLKKLVLSGEVEALHDAKKNPNAPGVWRWVPPEPEFQALQALAAAQETGSTTRIKGDATIRGTPGTTRV